VCVPLGVPDELAVCDWDAVAVCVADWVWLALCVWEGDWVSDGDCVCVGVSDWDGDNDTDWLGVFDPVLLCVGLLVAESVWLGLWVWLALCVRVDD
jgi:hypothetical protein